MINLFLYFYYIYILSLSSAYVIISPSSPLPSKCIQTFGPFHPDNTNSSNASPLHPSVEDKDAARRPGLLTLRIAGINSHPHPPPSQVSLLDHSPYFCTKKRETIPLWSVRRVGFSRRWFYFLERLNPGFGVVFSPTIVTLGFLWPIFSFLHLVNWMLNSMNEWFLIRVCFSWIGWVMGFLCVVEDGGNLLAGPSESPIGRGTGFKVVISGAAEKIGKRIFMPMILVPLQISAAWIPAPW